TLHAIGGTITGNGTLISSGGTGLDLLTDGRTINLTHTRVDSLTVDTTNSGGVVVGANATIGQDTGTIDLSSVDTGTGGILSVTNSNGAITVGGTVTANGGISLTTTGGSITGAGLITSAATLTLVSNGSNINLSNIQVNTLSANSHGT